MIFFVSNSFLRQYPRVILTVFRDEYRIDCTIGVCILPFGYTVYKQHLRSADSIDIRPEEAGNPKNGIHPIDYLYQEFKKIKL